MRLKEVLVVLFIIGFSISFLSFFSIRLFCEETKDDAYLATMTEVKALLSKGDNDGAIKLLESSIDKYPEKNYNILFNLGFLYLRQNNFDKLMDCYERGLERGYYFAIWIDAEPWKSNYETNERFKKIVEMNSAKLAEANKVSKAEHLIYKPENLDPKKKYPVLILLHGWNDNLPYFQKMWITEMMKNDVIVGVLRSSQVIGWEAYGWDNKETARKDIKEMYEDIVANYPADTNKVILGGFSQGGKTAMEAAFHQVIPATGFIAHAPGGGLPDDVDAQMIKSAQEKGLKGIIFAGKEDHLTPEQQELEKFLTSNGYKGKFEWIEGMKHFYPKDFQSRLDNAIKSIVE